MANDDMKVSVKLDSDAKQKMLHLRAQKRKIDKELASLSSSMKDEGKLEEWKMIHELKQEVIVRLRKQGVSWKKFIDTPDWIDYAWYSTAIAGVRRLKTSISLPAKGETQTDEATMIKLAAEQRTKIVRRKKRNTKKKTDTDTTKSGKSEAQKTGGVV